MQVSGTLASGRVEFLQPDGTLLAATYLSGGGTFLEPISLPVSGTYAIVVDPTSGSGGTVTVRLYDVPADTTATIAAGGSATVTTAAPGQNGTLTFTGTVNQRVSVKLTSASVTSGWLSLNAPDGTVLDSQPIGTSGAFLDARTPVRTRSSSTRPQR